MNKLNYNTAVKPATVQRRMSAVPAFRNGALLFFAMLSTGPHVFKHGLLSRANAAVNGGIQRALPRSNRCTLSPPSAFQVYKGAAHVLHVTPTYSWTSSIGRRLYAKSADDDLWEDEEWALQQELEEENQIRSQQSHVSLDSFFDADQKVGETRVYVRPKPKAAKFIDEEVEAALALTPSQEQHLIEEEFRKAHGVSESEFEMALGLSPFRSAERKAYHKPVKTVAIEKLAESGNLSLEDLSQLDYDSLREFAKQNQIDIQDFFKTRKTPEGEESIIQIPIGSAGGMGDEFDEVDDPDRLIERSKAYLRSMRPSPKHFRDRIRVRCMAGSGGKGGVSFYRDTKVHRGPPDGGDGGDGGSVIFIAADNKKPSLTSLHPSYRATNGQPGSRSRRKGKSGADVIVEVPLGTVISEYRHQKKASIDEDLDDATPQNYERTTSDLFMDPEYAAQVASQHSATPIASSQDAPLEAADLESMTPEQRLKHMEQQYRQSFSDPREGRPWAPPTLPESHPLHENANLFYNMVADYNSGAGSKTTSSDAQDIPAPVFSFTGKHGAEGSEYAYVSPGMKEALSLEDFDIEMLEHEPISGSDLVEKYRMKGPAGQSHDSTRHSNAPRSVDLDQPGAYFVAARGGAGGLGNFRLAGARKRPQAVGTPGKPGESIMYQLELKLIADVGLVGFPNAGKSTFLSTVSRAKPKIASYPFTTLSPEIGTVKLDDTEGVQFTIADLPGLVEGAHANRGLGHQFLRHIERTSVLVYVIDMSGGDNRNPWKTFLTLWDELERYQSSLVQKPSIIVANKMDAGNAAHENLKEFSKQLKSDKTFKKLKIYPISASNRMNTISVINALRQLLDLPTYNEGYAKLKTQVQDVRQRGSGLVTMNTAPHLSESFRNIK